MSDDPEQLVRAVRARVEGTPYVLTETPGGFDLAVDVADARWHSLLHEQHVDRTWTYHVAVEDPQARVLSITDDARSVTWQAGVASGGGTPTPVLGGSASRELGRLQSTSFSTSWAPSAQDGVREVADLRFDSAEGRDMVRGPARELGWSEQRGQAERVGLYAALGTVALLVVLGLVVAVLALTGVL